MSKSSIAGNALLEERASLLQVRRYIDSYTEIFRDYERNIRSFIQNATDVILPRLEKSGYYELNQSTITNYDDLKEALFKYSKSNDMSDLRRQINLINDLISENTMRKIHGDGGHEVDSIYQLRDNVQDRLDQIDLELEASNDASFQSKKDQRAA